MDPSTNDAPVRYCLYARKSSEQDERQALSIDAQAKEVRQIAERDGLEIVIERHESHSAKDSGQRPEYAAMLEDLRAGACNGILTWAPDRLSRNGGDLGQLVDLIDRGKLIEIRTPSQRFTNLPGDKFLLMILCSQAKLENDNKSVNVKRGLRAKVEMGYRPNMSPLGYLHDKYAPKGERRVYLDPERAPVIKEAFENVAELGWSGRDLKEWFDNEKRFKTRTGRQITLSMIYRMMSNPYYTGRFEFPSGSGKWFQGKYEPLVTQTIFDKVQETMKGVPHAPYGAKEFAFTRLMKCGECGSGISAEEKFKRLNNGTVARYVYYGCKGRWMKQCKQLYIREENLTDQLCKMIDEVEIDKIAASQAVRTEIEKMKKVAIMIGGSAIVDQLTTAAEKFDVRAYGKHVLKEGTREEKRDLLDKLKSNFVLKDGRVLLG
ncbi:MAG: recombinase family protein [Patescibacteria group bacterium]|nr:MAG: recombinase family protein [Patescibacteria group bacterium]